MQPTVVHPSLSEGKRITSMSSVLQEIGDADADAAAAADADAVAADAHAEVSHALRKQGAFAW